MPDPAVLFGAATGGSMRRSRDARRAVLTLLSTAMLGLALVISLWQQVEDECLAGTDLGDPSGACEPVRTAEVAQVPTDPADTVADLAG